MLEKISLGAVNLGALVGSKSRRTEVAQCVLCVRGLFLEGSTLVWDGFLLRARGVNSGISHLGCMNSCGCVHL